MKIIYKGKEYSLKDLKIAQKTFNDSLKIPEYIAEYNGTMEYRCFDERYKLVFLFYIEHYEQLISARFALINSYRKIQDSNYINWNSGDYGQYWLRFQYLKNSIIWYNSSFELILQSLWFGFKLYNKINFKNKPYNTIDSADAYKFFLEKCNIDNVKIGLEKSINSQDVIISLNKIKDSIEFKNIKRWSNNLKHKGNFIVKEIYYPAGGLKTQNFDSIYTTPEIIDIDIATETVKDFHIKLYEFAEEIFKLFNIPKIFEEMEKDKDLLISFDFEKHLLIKN